MINPLRRGKPSELVIQAGDVLFVCEGRDDCALVDHLTSDWNPRPKIGTRSGEDRYGWEDEFRQLANQIAMNRPAAVLFVFDAEKSAAQESKLLRKRCKAAGIPLPTTASRIESKRVRGISLHVGFHINPHGERQGFLESLFIKQVEQSNDWSCLRKLLSCYDKAKLPVGNRDKTIVRTYIARQKPHNTGLSVALKDGILRCDTPEFDAIKRFVEDARSAEGSTAQ